MKETLFGKGFLKHPGTAVTSQPLTLALSIFFLHFHSPCGCIKQNSSYVSPLPKKLSIRNLPQLSNPQLHEDSLSATQFPVFRGASRLAQLTFSCQTVTGCQWVVMLLPGVHPWTNQM